MKLCIAFNFILPHSSIYNPVEEFLGMQRQMLYTFSLNIKSGYPLHLKHVILKSCPGVQVTVSLKQNKGYTRLVSKENLLFP